VVVVGHLAERRSRDSAPPDSDALPRPERPFPRNPGCSVRSYRRQGLSGRFGVIRVIVVPPAAAE
jgi:hypothetical protein